MTKYICLILSLSAFQVFSMDKKVNITNEESEENYELNFEKKLKFLTLDVEKKALSKNVRSYRDLCRGLGISDKDERHMILDFQKNYNGEYKYFARMELSYLRSYYDNHPEMLNYKQLIDLVFKESRYDDAYKFFLENYSHAFEDDDLEELNMLYKKAKESSGYYCSIQ